jgi:hypothetical protein
MYEAASPSAASFVVQALTCEGRMADSGISPNSALIFVR